VLAVHIEGCAGLAPSPRSISSVPGTSRSADDGATGTFSLVQLKPGTEVELVLGDGSLLQGYYRGLERMGDEAYRERIAAVASALPDSVVLPELGSTLVIERRWAKPYSAQLLGFGLYSLELRRAERAEPELVPFMDLAVARDSASGRAWTAADLSADAFAGRLPAFSEIVIGVAAGERRIPVDQVAKVSYRNPAGEWVGGLLLLGLVGVAVVGIVAISSANWGWGCSDIELPPMGT
jgi:hypothetical protein